jgi:isopenicillin N synthase-like dioxygenase
MKTQLLQEMEKLAADLLKGFALALHLPEEWFQDKIDMHTSALRVMWVVQQRSLRTLSLIVCCLSRQSLSTP